MDYASTLLQLLPSARRLPGLRELINSIEVYLPADQVERVRAAAEFGAEAHEGQKRLSGEPYIAHPLAAAQILADLHLDLDTIIAAILHDVIEDTPISKEELSEKFGAPVAEIVDGVTKLDQIQFKSRAEAQAESFRKMVLAMVRDLRVILVKLADRTHNMRTLEYMREDKRQRIAQETLDIYAPLANRLGISWIKTELEDLSLRLRSGISASLQSPRPRAQEGARQPEAVPQQDRRDHARGAGESRPQGRRQHARETSVQHLQQDAAQGCAAVRDRRRIRPAHRGR